MVVHNLQLESNVLSISAPAGCGCGCQTADPTHVGCYGCPTCDPGHGTDPDHICKGNHSCMFE